jgi:hypothetical protein
MRVGRRAVLGGGVAVAAAVTLGQMLRLRSAAAADTTGADAPAAHPRRWSPSKNFRRPARVKGPNGSPKS